MTQSDLPTEAWPIRPATLDDLTTVAEFNARLAAETEDKQLDRAVLEAGVRGLLEDDRRGRYFVACDGTRIVGQMMHTWEWSDWRNGDIWWLQSVYVLPDFRRRGVFRALFQHVAQLAEADPHVVGLRLYVEDANDRAQQTYRELGLARAGYHVMQRLFV